MRVLSRAKLCVCLGVLAACGGGGGGGSAAGVLPKLLIDDVTVALAAPRAALVVGLAGTAAELPPLAQFDLLLDASRVVFDGTAEPLVSLGTLDAALVAAGRIRVLVGDTSTKDTPPLLPTGPLLRLPFALGPAARSGDLIEVRVAAALGADADGDAKTFDTAPVVARIRVQ
ncbi:MAG: hypothetical protein IT457_17440 [Planctomycetes bacterium]|nr:hypothetical protein [Planctomycetota bacterium]